MKRTLLVVCAVLCSVLVASAQFKPKPFEMKVKYRGEVSVGGAFSNKMSVDAFFFNFKLKSALSRPYLETVHGVMISDYIFAGGGLGLQYYAGKLGELYGLVDTKEGKYTWGALAIPLFVNLKGFFPINDDWKPFLNLSLGGTVVAMSNATCVEDHTDSYEDYYNGNMVKTGSVYDNKHRGGFYCDFGAGVEYKRWMFSLGLQHQVMGIETTCTDYRYDGSVDTDTTGNTAKTYAFYLKVGVSF